MKRLILNMIEQKVKDIALLNSLTKNSKLTEEDVVLLAKKIDKSVAKKLGLA